MTDNKELLDAAVVVRDDIKGFLSGEWDGNDEGWESLILRLDTAINNTRKGSDNV